MMIINTDKSIECKRGPSTRTHDVPNEHTKAVFQHCTLGAAYKTPDPPPSKHPTSATDAIPATTGRGTWLEVAKATATAPDKRKAPINSAAQARPVSPSCNPGGPSPDASAKASSAGGMTAKGRTTLAARPEGLDAPGGRGWKGKSYQ
jgi:hypothetical protein